MRNKPAAFVLLAYWLLGLLGIVWGGFQPDGYWHHAHRGAWMYPVAGVIQMGGIAFAEALVIGLILRSWNYRWSWERALAAFAAQLVLTLFWGLSAMHSPNYVFLHLMWLFLGLVLSFGLLLASVAYRLGWKS